MNQAATPVESSVREIMYLGPKAKKLDTVTGTHGRVWNGPGDIQRTTKMEAIELTKHDIWKDVTAWPEEKRIQAVRDLKEKLRVTQRVTISQETIDAALDVASSAELQAELDRRARAPKLPTGIAAATGGNTRPVDNSEDDLEGGERTRPGKVSDVVAEIVGMALSMDPGKQELFDEDGNPTREAMCAALGYDITEKELKAALKSLTK